MERVSLRLPEDLIEDLDTYQDEHEVSRSEACRDLIASAIADERGPNVDERVQSVRDDLEQEITDLKRENDRLHRERRQILEQREEHDELVRAVEREQSLAERRAEAGFLTKTKWALFGMKTDD